MSDDERIIAFFRGTGLFKVKRGRAQHRCCRLSIAMPRPELESTERLCSKARLFDGWIAIAWKEINSWVVITSCCSCFCYFNAKPVHRLGLIGRVYLIYFWKVSILRSRSNSSQQKDQCTNSNLAARETLNKIEYKSSFALLSNPNSSSGNLFQFLRRVKPEVYKTTSFKVNYCNGSRCVPLFRAWGKWGVVEKRQLWGANISSLRDGWYAELFRRENFENPVSSVKRFSRNNCKASLTSLRDQW